MPNLSTGGGLNRRLPDRCFKGLIMIGASACSGSYFPLWGKAAAKLQKSHEMYGVELWRERDIYSFLTLYSLLFLIFLFFLALEERSPAVEILLHDDANALGVES